MLDIARTTLVDADFVDASSNAIPAPATTDPTSSHPAPTNVDSAGPSRGPVLGNPNP